MRRRCWRDKGRFAKRADVNLDHPVREPVGEFSGGHDGQASLAGTGWTDEGQQTHLIVEEPAHNVLLLSFPWDQG